MAGNQKIIADGLARVEEIRFFRSFGWDDKRIAERLGVKWEAMQHFFRRHPELGPINDPEETERQRWVEFNRAVSLRRRHRHG